MNIQTYCRNVRKMLENAGIENAVLEARWLIKYVLKTSDSEFIQGTMPVSQEQTAVVDRVILRRISGEPLSRIFGER
jgi:methylase of polypeptide subunit release factors